jgi:branched-chain amino acid transport system permease protein
MKRNERILLGFAIAGVLFLPAFLDESGLSLYVLCTLTATVTVGVSLLLGQAGQVSLGQGAFYAAGAYTAGVLATQGTPTLVALSIAPVAAALLAAFIGVPLLMLRGHHLAFGTLAMHLIFLSVVGEMSVTGGDVGLQGIPRLNVGSVKLDSVRSYAYLSAFVLLAVAIVGQNILSSRPGRALRALSTSELAAASSGIPVGRYKLAVFALSAAFAGLAGGVYAFYMGYLAPGSFPVLLSVEYVVMASIGGLGSIAGGVVGAVVVLLLVHGLSRVATVSGMPDSAPVILSYAVYALLLIVAVLFLPGGVTSIPALVRGQKSAAKP